MNSKIKIAIVAIIFNLACQGSFAQLPLVYNKENTGASFKPKDIAPNLVVIPFTIPRAGPYNFLARVNGSGGTHDSYWVKIDDGAFASANGFAGFGWQWGRLTSANLNAGHHSLIISYRENEAKLDKILITSSNTSTIINPESAGTNCGQHP